MPSFTKTSLLGRQLSEIGNFKFTYVTWSCVLFPSWAITLWFLQGFPKIPSLLYLLMYWYLMAIWSPIWSIKPIGAIVLLVKRCPWTVIIFRLPVHINILWILRFKDNYVALFEQQPDSKWPTVAYIIMKVRLCKPPRFKQQPCLCHKNSPNWANLRP